MEQIYTIPVNEAFDAVAADPTLGCPFCRLYKMLEENELDSILGASMMEPDIRVQTNREGFCRRHYNRMFKKKKILPMALTMESHLAEVAKLLTIPPLAKSPSLSALSALEDGCYVCRRIGTNLNAMVATAAYLYESDPAFPAKVEAAPFYCLPHLRALLDYAQKKMDKRRFRDFAAVLTETDRKYLDTLSGDVSWFCKKFDYRFDAEPWYNSKDSVRRAVNFLSGVSAAEENEEDNS